MASQPTRRPDDDPYYRIYEMRERERNSRVCKALRASKKKKPRRRSRSPVDGKTGSRKAQPLPAVELLSMEEQQLLRKQLFSPSRPTPPVGNIVISRSPPSPAASTVIEWTSDGAVFKSRSSNQESVVVAATASTERAVGVKTVTDDDVDAPDPDADVDADADGDGAADESHAPTLRPRWEVALAHSTERAAQTLGRVLRSYHRREQMLGGASKRALGGITYLAAATPRRRVAEPPSPGAGDGPVMPRAPRSPRRPSGSITSPLSMSPLASARRASTQSKTGPASVHPPAAFAAVAPPAEATGYASRRGSQLLAQEFVNALEADDDDDNDDDGKSMSPISSTNSLPPTTVGGGPPADGAAEEGRRASLVLEAKTEEEEVVVPGVPSNDLAALVPEVPTAPDSAPTAGEDRSPVPPLALGALDQAGTGASFKGSPPSMHPVLRHDSHKSQKSVQSAQSDVSSSSDGSRARPPIDRGGSAFGLAFLRSNENLQALVEEEEGDDDDSTASEHSTTPAESRKSVSPAPTTLTAAAPQDRGEHGPEPDVSGKAPTVDTDDVAEDEVGVPINTNLLAKLNKKFSLRH